MEGCERDMASAFRDTSVGVPKYDLPRHRGSGKGKGVMPGMSAFWREDSG